MSMPTDSGASGRSELRLTRAIVVVLLWAMLVGTSLSADAAGPWQGQVVAGDTKQPLEGVVVLAWWTRSVRSLGGFSEEYRDSQEVLTGKDGRFTIESRWFFSLNPLVFFSGPFVALFKSGYGDYEWPGYKGSETWPKEKRDALATAAQLFQLEGIVVEMAVLVNTTERTKYLKRIETNVSVMPLDKRPLMQEALMEEREALGYYRPGSNRRRSHDSATEAPDDCMCDRHGRAAR